MFYVGQTTHGGDTKYRIIETKAYSRPMYHIFLEYHVVIECMNKVFLNYKGETISVQYNY